MSLLDDVPPSLQRSSAEVQEGSVETPSLPEGLDPVYPEATFETRVIPDELEIVEFRLREVAHALGEDAEDFIGALGDVIEAANPEVAQQEVVANSQVMQRTEKALAGEHLPPEQLKTALVEFRQTPREVLAFIRSHAEEGLNMEEGAERTRHLQESLDLVRYLVSDAEALPQAREDLKDSLNSDQFGALDILRAGLDSSFVDFARKVSERSSDEAGLEEALRSYRRSRQRGMHEFFRAFNEEASKEDVFSWEQPPQTMQRAEDELAPVEEPVEALSPREQHKREIMRQYSNWGDRVQEDWPDNPERRVINTQMVAVDKSGKFLFLPTQKEVKASPPLFYTETSKVMVHMNGSMEIRRVVVTRAAFSEVRARSELGGGKYGEASEQEGFVEQDLYTLTSNLVYANSLVKAQETLWQLEAARREQGLYMVPVVRDGKATWLPLTENQYNFWKRCLGKTVKSFEKAGFDYVEMKEAQESEADDPIIIEDTLEDIEPSADLTWYNTHKAWAAVDEAFDEVSAEQNSEKLEEIRDGYNQAYMEFTAIYGREDEYLVIARENLERRGHEVTEESLTLEVSRVKAEFEVRKQRLAELATRSVRLMRYLREHPEEVDQHSGLLREYLSEYEDNMELFANRQILQAIEDAAEVHYSSSVNLEGHGNVLLSSSVLRMLSLPEGMRPVPLERHPEILDLYEEYGEEGQSFEAFIGGLASAAEVELGIFRQMQHRSGLVDSLVDSVRFSTSPAVRTILDEHSEDSDGDSEYVSGANVMREVFERALESESPDDAPPET